MFTNNKAKYYGDNKVLIDAACLSGDTKPTTGIANGSKCIEMDTGKTYMFNEEDSEWEELPSSGGGGGSSDFSTAEVTVVNNSETEYLQAYIPEVIANTNLSRGAAIDGDPSSTETHTVILAKDGCEMSIVGLSLNIEASGNASVNRGMMGYVVTITGDCTITASDPT